MSYKFKGLKFSQFEVGQIYYTARRTITEADVVNFAGLTGDFNPLHVDEVYAQETPFKKRIAHGMLGVAIATGLANQLGIFEGTTIALLSQTISYKGPVFFGDTVQLELHVKDTKPSSKGGKGVVTFSCPLKNQRGETIVEGEWVVMMVD